VRCRACEEKREHEPGRVRAPARQRGGLSLFADASGA
jgi:hypothetical protein